jgi:hypothetical protein
MVCCSRCSRVFDIRNESEFRASISGSIAGDECIESYYYCDSCGVYTKEIFWDRFMGEESVYVQGPIDKADGDANVTLIGKCSEPWDKRCRCPAHTAYFEGLLD